MGDAWIRHVSTIFCSNPMIDLQAYRECLDKCGVEFISGVPDTLLNDLCLYFERDWPEGRHVIAANEGGAIALAAGYHLATGTVPMVYMQNSGLGNAVNPLASLADRSVYGIPMVLVVGWRGAPGTNDWPQHQRQGELTPKLLTAMGIPHRVVSEPAEAVAATIWATAAALESSTPTALVIRKGVFALPEKAGFGPSAHGYEVSREQAIEAVISAARSDALFVATTGRATRELHALRVARNEPHDRDFLNVGAMGHALSIAMGLALARPDLPVICLDGDGAGLMHMGSLAIAGKSRCPNLLHVLLNNGVHESVGGQGTAGFATDFCSVARNCGYTSVNGPLREGHELTEAVRSMHGKGPGFIEMRICKGMRADVPVLRMEPEELKNQLMARLTSRGESKPVAG
ncbi:phosphonopyruvate decarboxylase [Haloferula sp. A504]|uniref:phosphonopyruvate decarboxylase n=1 Tax=Haloferula sp. A504 TaxID=3373601 RepID=UPI0031BD5F9A|nr:phosphonopyruvate decarboxylase [Verrucomicrobiaceae bacterium E54]